MNVTTSHNPTHTGEAVGHNRLIDERPPAIGRWAAVAALAAGLLVIVSGGTTGHPPFPDRTAASVLRWYAAHRDGTIAMELLMTLAAGALVVFAAGLSGLAGGLASRASAAIRCFTAASVALAVLMVVGGWSQLTLAAAGGRPASETSDSSVRLLSDLTWLHWSGLLLILAVAAAALTVLSWDGEIGGRWVSWPAAVSAALACVGGIADFFPAASGRPNPLGLLGYVGHELFAIALLLAGILSLARSRRPASAS